MDQDAVERARKRLEKAGTATDPAELETVIGRAREALETLAVQTSELETSMPERLDEAIREGLRAEARPIGRQLAEVRGLTNGTIRRLERIQHDVDAERLARVEDLALLVDRLVRLARHRARLDRLERTLDRLERSLEDRPVAELYRLEDRERKSGA